MIRILYCFFAIIIDILYALKIVKKKYIHTASWILLVISILPFPKFLYSPETDNQIVAKVFLYIFPFYILMTVSYEALFFIIFYNLIQIWVAKRQLKKGFNEDNMKFKGEYLIELILYLFLSYASSFSTGVLANISGFDIKSVFRFVTKYYPFIMMSLIIAKIILPFILVNVGFCAVCKHNGASACNIFLVLGAICEPLCIFYFFKVKDDGSWLDMGLSIGYFALSNFIALSHLILLMILLVIYKYNKIFSGSSVKIVEII